MTQNLVGLRKPDTEREFLRCSHSPLCEGPRLRADHDDVCDDGEECDDEACWRGCQFCLAEKDVQ